MGNNFGCREIVKNFSSESRVESFMGSCDNLARIHK